MLSRPQSIVLVCANSPEMCTPDGLCTGALAIAYAKRGHRVRVLCSANSAYEPWRSHAGSISVHRIDTRKGAGEHGFAALAIGRVVELARIGQTGQTGQTGHCDVIECVDVPSCALGLGALRRSGVVQTPIVSVVVDRALHASATGQAARRVCDATVYTQKPSEDDAGCVIPFPIEPDAWNPPSSDGSMFVCCDANGDGVDHSFLTEAF
ncbi:MAG: glycosyltransferase, partial [Phycisphaerales bacterium]|nr:glycosyltransferase [Phycisphaerales bacterium]